MHAYTVFTRLNVTASISYLSVKSQCSSYSNVTVIRYLKIIFALLNLKFIVTLGAAFSKVNMVSENLNCLFITCYVFMCCNCGRVVAQPLLSRPRLS